MVLMTVKQFTVHRSAVGHRAAIVPSLKLIAVAPTRKNAWKIVWFGSGGLL